MFRTLTSVLAALTVALGTTTTATAQDRAMVPLKLDLVISRQAGAKKVSSLPYTLWLTANAPDKGTSLRMGVRVPVPTVVSQGKEGGPPISYTYQNVGTNIDALASSAPDGRFGLSITLNDTGVDPKGVEGLAGATLLREFTSRFYLLLRDGQTATYTSATDPVTGETLKVDVTLSVLK